MISLFSKHRLCVQLFIEINGIDDEFQTNERVSKVRFFKTNFRRLAGLFGCFSYQKRPNECLVGRTGSWWCQYYSPTIDREVCRVPFEMWRTLLTLDVENTLLEGRLNQASSQPNFIMQKKLFRRVTCGNISRRCGSFNSDAVS
jgi:hypothetical protein